MNLSFTSSKPTLLLLLFCFLFQIDMTLSQKIIIDQLRSVEFADNGLSQIITTPSTDKPLQALSLFGWIKINSPNQSGNIFSLYPINKPNTNLSDNPETLLSLSYISWEATKLGFASFDLIHGESTSYFDLNSEELNSWIFIYTGHSFTYSQQTNFIRKVSDSSKVVTKQTDLKNPHNYHLLILGCGSYLRQIFFFGDIERLSVQFGKEAYEETNFERFYILHPETIPTCPLAFSQCGYTGEKLELCKEVRGYREIKSIFMGKLKEQLEICFGQNILLINESIECLSELDLISLQEKKLFIPNELGENGKCYL